MKRMLKIIICMLISFHALGFDPMAPPNMTSVIERTPTAAKKPTWVLKQTVITDQRQIAVINNEVLTKGSLYRGWVVEKIEPGAVALSKQGRKKTLTVTQPKGSVKQRKDPL